MRLEEFVSKFVCKNSLIRLWKPNGTGNKMIYEADEECTNVDPICMEWQFLQDKVWQSKYKDCKVLGVKDIFYDSFYKEAINIVIEVD